MEAIQIQIAPAIALQWYVLMKPNIYPIVSAIVHPLNATMKELFNLIVLVNAMNLYVRTAVLQILTVLAIVLKFYVKTMGQSLTIAPVIAPTQTSLGQFAISL